MGNPNNYLLDAIREMELSKRRLKDILENENSLKANEIDKRLQEVNSRILEAANNINRYRHRY